MEHKTKKVMSTLMDKLVAITVANTVKARGASGKKTYLDRFVDTLLDENGQPTSPKSRIEIIATISYDIACETRQEEMLTDSTLKPFDLDSASDLAIFAEINNKVKHQIAAAVSDSNNSTALSYNVQYKDIWVVVKQGSLVSLAPKTAATPQEVKKQAKAEAATAEA